MFFNQNLKFLRKTNNLNQSELATKLNVTRDTIASLENKRMNPSFELLIKIRDYFNVNLDDLVFKNLAN